MAGSRRFSCKPSSLSIRKPQQEEVCVLVTDAGEIRLRLFPDQAPWL